MSAKFHLMTGPSPFPIGLAWDDARPQFDKVMVVFSGDTANSNTTFQGSLVGFLRYVDPTNGDFVPVPCQVEALIDDTETTGLTISMVAALPRPITLGTNRKLSLWVQKPIGCNNASSAARDALAWEHFYFLRNNYVE